MSCVKPGAQQSGNLKLRPSNEKTTTTRDERRRNGWVSTGVGGLCNFNAASGNQGSEKERRTSLSSQKESQTARSDETFVYVIWLADWKGTQEKKVGTWKRGQRMGEPRSKMAAFSAFRRPFSGSNSTKSEPQEGTRGSQDIGVVSGGHLKGAFEETVTREKGCVDQVELKKRE